MVIVSSPNGRSSTTRVRASDAANPAGAKSNAPSPWPTILRERKIMSLSTSERSRNDPARRAPPSRKSDRTPRARSAASAASRSGSLDHLHALIRQRGDGGSVRSRPRDHEGRRLTRRADERRLQRNACLRVEHDAPRLDARSRSVAHRERGIVGEHGPDADGDRVAVRAQSVHLGASRRAGDPPIVRRRIGDAVVGRERELERHPRTLARLRVEERRVQLDRGVSLLRRRQVGDDARRAKLVDASARLRGSGRATATTTRDTPARMIASAHGGVLP